MKTAHYYCTAYAQSKCNISTCSHEHPSVHSAVACISSADGYVVAMEECKRVRPLTRAEEVEYQFALLGKLPKKPAFSQLLRAVRSLVESAYSSSADEEPGNPEGSPSTND